MGGTLDEGKLETGLKRLRNPLTLIGFQGVKMPLGLAAGLRVDSIDRTSCRVSLPGGWRTQNPFGSMYWAAQGMAAEMATGLHGYVLASSAPVPVRMILARCEGSFSRMCKGRATFVFDQGERVVEVIEETLRSGASIEAPCEVVGFDAGGEEVSRWVFTWSFRAKR